MNPRRFAKLAAILVLGACLPTHAAPPKEAFAVFTQKDPGFTETITLYTDGRYEQVETQDAKPLYRAGSLHSPVAATAGFFEPGRGGTWLILDKQGGVPISYKPGDSFPATAVIELKGAMPFGLSWENQLPYNLHGDRYLQATLFQDTRAQSIKPAAAPPAQLARRGVIVFGSPLPDLVRP